MTKTWGHGRKGRHHLNTGHGPGIPEIRRHGTFQGSLPGSALCKVGTESAEGSWLDNPPQPGASHAHLPLHLELEIPKGHRHQGRGRRPGDRTVGGVTGGRDIPWGAEPLCVGGAGQAGCRYSDLSGSQAPPHPSLTPRTRPHRSASCSTPHPGTALALSGSIR